MENILSFEQIMRMVKPLAVKYNIESVYLFGSYARGEANDKSDLDFLVYGGGSFKPTMIFAFAEELRKIFDKNIDVFEICEINQDSDMYQTIMKEKVLVA